MNMYKYTRDMFLLSFLVVTYPLSAYAATTAAAGYFSLSGWAASIPKASIQNMINLAPIVVGLAVGLIALVGLLLVGSSVMMFIKAGEAGGQVTMTTAWFGLASGVLMLTFATTLQVMKNTLFTSVAGSEVYYVMPVAKLSQGQLLATAAIIYIQVIGVFFLGTGLHSLSKIGEPSKNEESKHYWMIIGGFFCINFITISRIIFCNTLGVANPVLLLMGKAC